MAYSMGFEWFIWRKIIAANKGGSYRNWAEFQNQFLDRVTVQADLPQFIRFEVRLVVIRQIKPFYILQSDAPESFRR